MTENSLLKKKNLFRLRQCMQTKHGINFRYSGVFSTLHWDLEGWGALNLSEILTLKMTDEKKTIIPTKHLPIQSQL